MSCSAYLIQIIRDNEIVGYEIYSDSMPTPHYEPPKYKCNSFRYNTINSANAVTFQEAYNKLSSELLELRKTLGMNIDKRYNRPIYNSHTYTCDLI